MFITETALRNEINKMCEGKTKVEVAKFFGITNQYLGDIIKGDRRISKTVASKLGYRPVKIDVKVDRQYELIKKTK